jgi:uncharacterized cupin superfamily protein
VATFVLPSAYLLSIPDLQLKPYSTSLPVKFNPNFFPMTTLKISTNLWLSLSVKIALFVITATPFTKVYMQNIVVEKKPAQSRLDSLNVAKWPTWEKEVSVFPWVFPEQEIAYILEGECVITPEGGKPVKFGKGDLVTFPAGMKASWEVKKPLHKHYKLDGNALTQILRRIKLKIGL